VTIPLHPQRRTVRQALPTLSLKARRILELRFGLGQEPCYTLAEVGERLGISAARARQLEQQALQSLGLLLWRPTD